MHAAPRQTQRQWQTKELQRRSRQRGRDDAAVNEIDVRLAIVGLEDELRGVSENQADSHGHENLHEMGAITNGPDQRHVNEIAENKKRDAGRKKTDIWIDLEIVKKNVGGIHANHEKSAMSKVDDAHDAKNQGQAHADDGVERPGQQTISTGL